MYNLIILCLAFLAHSSPSLWVVLNNTVLCLFAFNMAMIRLILWSNLLMAFKTLRDRLCVFSNLFKSNS